MSMKFPILICLLINFSVSVFADQNSQKERRRAAKDNFFEVENLDNKRVKVDYNIRNRAKDLHRKAVKAFYLADFKDSEACFSLSMNAWGNSSKLLFEFSLCSSLYPKPYRSFDRAKELLKMYRSKIKKSDSSVSIIQAVIAWQSGDLNAAKEQLQKIEKGSRFYDISTKMLKNIGLEKPLLNRMIIEKLMPVQLSSNEKRSRRS